MSAPLSPEEEEQYTRIIDGILATANLETITRKKIRAGLEAALGGEDLSEQKSAIKALIEQRFDAISNPPPEPSAPTPSPTKRQANGHPDDDEPDPDADKDEIKVSMQPPKKKQRVKSEDEDADAKLAALLQAEENRGTGRSTRGGGAKAKPVKKRKKKSAAKVHSDSEDNNSGESGEVKKKKAGGGFQKPFNLSAPLAELTGETQLSRPQVVKKLWEHIEANELQDPKDKRQILCDEKMHAVFKQTKIDMFQMNKHVGNHLYPIDEE